MRFRSLVPPTQQSHKRLPSADRWITLVSRRNVGKTSPLFARTMDGVRSAVPDVCVLEASAVPMRNVLRTDTILHPE